MARFDFDFFSRDQQSVAQLVPAAAVFTLLNRRVRMPAECMALAWSSDGQPSLVLPGAELEGDGLTRIMVVRAEPVGFEYQFAGLPSADAHEISTHLRLAVQLVPERSELSSFYRRVLAGGDRVTHSQLRRHCEETVQLCAAAFCKARAAEELLRLETWDQVDGALAEAFKSFGFESGISLGPDVRAEFRSPGFADVVRQRKADDARKQRMDADAAVKAASNEAREKHIASLASMTEKVRAMAAAGAGVSVPDLIKTFDSTQRGELYGSLLATSPVTKKTAAVLVVAGEEIISIDPGSRKIVSRRAIDTRYGPLRSVRTAMHGDARRILVGSRNGVHVLDAELSGIESFGFEPPRPLRGGVNAAAIFINEYLYASHSEVGLIGWKLEGPDKSHSIFKSEETARRRAVRDVQVDDGGVLFFSADSKVVALQGDPGFSRELEYPSIDAEAEVSALLVADGHVYAGLVNGAVHRWHAKSGEEQQIVRPRTGDAVESLDWLAGGGVPRLLVADRRPVVELRVVGDTYTAEYHAPQAIRWAWATDRSIAGVNDRRDQLLFWELGNPATPIAVVQVAKLCGHTIQDAAVL
jgi:hypothetical protein